MRHSLLCLNGTGWPSAVTIRTQNSQPWVFLIELEQDFVGSGLEVNRHAILVDRESSGRELLEHPGSVHPDPLAVIDAKQEYGVDRLLEFDHGISILNYRQRLFIEHDLGESSVSTVDVARRAGYPSGLTHHFFLRF